MWSSYEYSGRNGDHQIVAHYMVDGNTYNYHAESTQVQTGTTTTTIPEQGHYEQVWVED